jgi:AcrR family transcriptional regulator
MTSRVDGRDSRWAQHRTQRRRELVDAALRAIRKHGPSVGMDEIASEAGTSKTVVYRHFGDRTGLYVAVVESVDQRILDSLGAAMVGTDPDDATALVGAMVDAYLGLVEKDPEIYRFVVTRPLVEGPVTGDPLAEITDRIGAQVARALRSYLLRHGQDASCAETWGRGLVGFVRAAADHWLTSDRPRPRGAVVADVTTLFAPAFNEIGGAAYTTTVDHDED